MSARFIILLGLSFFCLQPSFSQTRIRDVYAAAPDSIFPLLTRNNRLDQIDFFENKMPAIVKNRFEERAELLALTDRYLQLRLSQRCTVEMRLLSDSTLCMVETFAGPAPDSRIRLFDAEWHELTSTTRKPAVHEFLEGDIDEDVRLALEALPLIKASLSEEGDSISFELQTSELTREQQKKAEGKLHNLKFSIK